MRVPYESSLVMERFEREARVRVRDLTTGFKGPWGGAGCPEGGAGCPEGGAEGLMEEEEDGGAIQDVDEGRCLGRLPLSPSPPEASE